MILTDSVLLIEPNGFDFNDQTAHDNKFQTKNRSSMAKFQFDQFKSALESEEINIYIFSPEDATTPDAVYPNNWFSTFPDSKLFIYPMRAMNRRNEKRPEFIKELRDKYTNFTDLSYLEKTEHFLEGTGSLVIDHELKQAYACISNRTTLEAILEWKKISGYSVINFVASDENNFPFYHTNVILTLAENFAIICLDAIMESDKNRIRESILSAGREIISISHAQVRKFCGNCLAVKNRKGEQLLIMSDQAKNAFTTEQLAKIQNSCRIISSDLSEIEQIGGGGARCMVAELF